MLTYIDCVEGQSKQLKQFPLRRRNKPHTAIPAAPYSPDDFIRSRVLSKIYNDKDHQPFGAWERS